MRQMIDVSLPPILVVMAVATIAMPVFVEAAEKPHIVLVMADDKCDIARR